MNALSRMPARLAVSGSMVAVLLLALGGCASKPKQPAWRIVPVQSVAHGAGSAEGYYLIGRQIEHSRDWLRAADAYRQALKADPGHVDARNALAVVLARSGQLNVAEDHLRQALATAPQRADLHSNLGFLLMLTQRHQEAQVALHTALALNPQDRVAQTNLLLAQGRVPASPATPSAAQAQAAATATTAAATTTPAAAVPAAAAPRTEARVAAPTLQVANHATLAPLEQEQAPRAGSAIPKALDDAAVPATMAALPQGAAVVAAAPQAAMDAKPFTLELSNGVGRRGAAVKLRSQLRQRGFEVQRTSNQPPYRQPYTVVLYQPGQEAAARRVAQALPLSVPLQPDTGQRSSVRVLIGHDWPEAVRVADAGMLGE